MFQRILVANRGEIALRVGLTTFADVIDVHGARVTPQQVAKVFTQNRKMGKTSNFMIMQERKSKDAVTESLENAKFLKDISREMGNNEVRMSVLG